MEKNRHADINGQTCGCGRYYEDCREGVRGDDLAESLYCHYGYVGALDKCGDCNLVNYGMDCKNNKIA